MSLSIDRVLRKAERHAKNGETDLAAQEYKSVLERFPNNKRAIEGLAALQRRKAKETDSRAGPSQPQIDALIALYRQGKLQETLTYGETLAKQFPNVPFTPNIIGAANAGLGRMERAVACYKRALQIKPDYTVAHNNLGIALQDLGKPEEALASFRTALQIDPEYADAHYNLGNALAGIGKPEKAVASYDRALRINPDHAEAHNNRGTALKALGKPEEAVASYKKAVYVDSEYAEAYNNLGAALNDLGKPGEAVSRLTKALQITPRYAEAHNNLGNALQDLGEHEQAIASYNDALTVKPDYAEAHYNLGNAFMAVGMPTEAASSYYEALQFKPDYADAHNNLGTALKALRKPEEAVASYSKALQIKPDYAEGHSNLGAALIDLGRPDQAVASFARALQIKPDYAEAHNNLGAALNDLGNPAQALLSLTEALRINPSYAEAHNNRGAALHFLGKLEEAAVSYDMALHFKPDYAEAHRNLSTIKRYEVGDAQIRQMVELIEQDNLPKRDRMQLNFALGNAHGDVGDHDKAFFHLLSGNRLRKEELEFDISVARASFAKVKSRFSEDVPGLDSFPGSEHGEGRQPVFILGMPRSGTTLVEQVLASHSRVYGAGELVLLGESVNAIEWKSTQFSSDRLRVIRESYLAGLEKIGASEPYITDKMPLNFWWIGFIFSAIPEAKVIHVKRDARATCWSNFKQYFSRKGVGFAYDLRDVAEFYKMYVDLMAFWHDRFPGRIYDLSYETFTEHQEEETGKLLGHVGLTWEAQCLAFHETERAVQTASAAQVRQEMYQGSSEEWRKYEKHLEPMVELLKGY